MNVLFKSMPIGIRAEELAEFIQLKVNEQDFGEHTFHISEASIEMMEIQDNFTHPLQQFGLVKISPPDVAKIVIQQLNGQQFNEYTMTVCEYFDRSKENDSRHKLINSTESILEKRQKDRRKDRLKYSRLI